MRLHRLDLLKYGKFTGRMLDLPAAPRDFHLIVGANEAGKSTLRGAILDLLFGIPARTPLAFLHPLNELRVGAVIGNRSGMLEFQRAKAQKQTLRTPQDAVLPDNALLPYLGSADRHFFDQMFGLDHTRLVNGGNSILNAENDIGQVLFQSAAGVASLGKVRDALLAEADKLWAPRKAADRAYYRAAELLDKAGAALKETTVRTKVWSEANARLEAVKGELDGVGALLRQLEVTRSRFERIRRCAPFLQAVRDIEQQLRDLGDVTDFPPDAAATLSSAQQDLAVAAQLLELRSAEAASAQHELARVRVDETVLRCAADIGALDECRLRYGAHERDIGRREEEIGALLAEIRKACAQLGWECASEDEPGARLPSSLLRRELAHLAQARGALVQASRAAQQSEQSKASEIRLLTEELAQIAGGDVRPALRAALANARALGDTEAALQKQHGVLAKARAELAAAELALGKWSKPIPELAALQLPGQEELLSVAQDRQTLVADRRALDKRIQEQAEAVSMAELKIAQVKEMHQPAAQEAVAQARQQRDASWSAIREGAVGLQQGAPQFEDSLRRADELADKRHENVQAAAELQNQQHQLQRALLQQSVLTGQSSQLKEEIAQFDRMWDEAMTALGLPGMKLDAIGDWIGKRETALAAAAACQDAQDGADALVRTVDDARLALAAALRDAGLLVPDTDTLAALCAQAEHHIQSMEAAKVRRETLEQQLKAARTQAQSLAQAAAEASAAAGGWNEQWARTLSKAQLAPDSETGTVAGALELFALLDELLGKVRQIRAERIGVMRAELEQFADDARRLAAQAGAPADLPPAQIAQELVRRLTLAQQAQGESTRLKEALRLAQAQVAAAEEAIRTANASLQPLLARAGVDSPALLADAIARSDARRRLTEALARAKSQLLDGGDGLGRDQIEAEVDGTDLAQLAPELAETTAAHADAVQRQAALAAEREKALAACAAIGGSDAAALAEAQRQEALAQMADAAERYVKVLTAGRLLRWSIDRYREEKQGPLLGRASEIFAQLTQGAFQRLIVDYEAQPMVLEGQRADGKPVPVSGMSDGTRDQLYLALRLAALELHLQQAPPLPFIADDLFINYDDGRAAAGFEALAALSEKTQVIYLTHHEHLVAPVRQVFGEQVSVVHL